MNAELHLYDHLTREVAYIKRCQNHKKSGIPAISYMKRTLKGKTWCGGNAIAVILVVIPWPIATIYTCYIMLLSTGLAKWKSGTVCQTGWHLTVLWISNWLQFSWNELILILIVFNLKVSHLTRLLNSYCYNTMFKDLSCICFTSVQRYTL